MSLARRNVVDKVRAWGVLLDDETADAIGLVASELITNAVIHGEGPVTVALYHRPGRLVIEVLDHNPSTPRPSWAQVDEESGRGLALVGLLASRCAWESTGRGKRVWAEIVLPMAAPAARSGVLRQLVVPRPKHGAGSELGLLAEGRGELDRGRPADESRTCRLPV
ncbi:ATP-binding protein [Streptomyces sp. H51]|uniref:ATP-binding protein n=1 Tax=Streptomyces sp. H51 TaxID=3111770 RepID=UPI002D77029D|nr:ATP-binding protein [Streptomyces sp. H51]